MGIAGFFGKWIRNYKEHIHVITGFTEGIDNIMIDMNALVHHSIKNNEKHIEIFKGSCRRIYKYFELFKPKRVLIMLDGVAPLAKQIQQRKRRMASKVDGSFDSSLISPGTNFMMNLEKSIMKWCIKTFRATEIIFSGSLNPGEGEHKIMTYMRYYADPNETHCFISPDADVINLSICAIPHSKHMYMLRSEVMRNGSYENTLLDISSIAENWNRQNPTISNTDFVNFLSIIGNDFIPSIIGQNVYSTTLDRVFGLYKASVTGSTIISIDSLKKLFAILQTQECSTLVSQNGKWLDSSILQKHIKDNQIDIVSFRKDYYSLFPSDTDINDVCHNYLDGLFWMKEYYLYGVPSWRWFYKYDLPPLVSDLYKSLDTYNYDGFGRSIPLEPMLQLCMILNRQTLSEVLPVQLRSLVDDQRLQVYFPSTWKYSLVGKFKEFEAIPLVDKPDVDVMSSVFYSLKKDLKLIENTRYALKIHYQSITEIDI